MLNIEAEKAEKFFLTSVNDLIYKYQIIVMHKQLEMLRGRIHGSINIPFSTGPTKKTTIYKKEMAQQGGKKKAPTEWNLFVKKIFHEGRKNNANYKFKNALEDASRRKNEMSSSGSSSSSSSSASVSSSSPSPSSSHHTKKRNRPSFRKKPRKHTRYTRGNRRRSTRRHRR